MDFDITHDIHHPLYYVPQSNTTMLDDLLSDVFESIFLDTSIWANRYAQVTVLCKTNVS